MKKKSFRIQEGSALIALFLLIACIIVGGCSIDYFFASRYWINIFKNYTPVILITLSFAIAQIGGACDISVGAVASLVNVVIIFGFAEMGLPPWVCIIMGVTTGIVCGMLKGLIVTKLRLNALISTFAFSWLAQGLAMILIPNSEKFNAIMFVTKFYGKRIGGIPMSAFFVVFGLLIWFVYSNTRNGMQLYAVGQDKRRAYFTGIDCDKQQMIAFTLGGVYSALAGVALTGLLASGQSTYGDPLTTQAIASSAIGGVSLLGGSGNLFGAALGALLVGLMSQLVLGLVKTASMQPIVTHGMVLMCIVLPSAIQTIIRYRRKSYE